MIKAVVVKRFLDFHERPAPQLATANPIDRKFFASGAHPCAAGRWPLFAHPNRPQLFLPRAPNQRTLGRDEEASVNFAPCACLSVQGASDGSKSACRDSRVCLHLRTHPCRHRVARGGQSGLHLISLSAQMPLHAAAATRPACSSPPSPGMLFARGRYWTGVRAGRPASLSSTMRRCR